MQSNQQQSSIFLDHLNPATLPSCGSRLAAAVLDTLFLIFLAFAWLFTIVMSRFLVSSPNSFVMVFTIFVMIVYSIATLVFVVFYSALCLQFKSKTLGKHLCNLKVVDITRGDDVRAGQAWLRWLIYTAVSAFIFIFPALSIVWEKHRRGWHDLAASTVVVYQHQAPAS